ncbi:MAG TPA: AAA family ATPase [Candidatus Bathyarchaeia archaeon]|nr:AAA family ATPase [Candidatus Bathyarchaeia archaeon]
MPINSLRIKNLRSIKKLTVAPSNLCALIGPNSVGKTNILKALNLVIGEGWTTKAKVARELFHDPNQRIEIEVGFSEPIAFTDRRDNKVRVESIKLEMSMEPELSAQTTINGGSKFFAQDEFKKLCHFILIPSERNLVSELRVSQWTMLGKLMRLVYENYVSQYRGDEQRLKDEFALKIQPAKEFLEHDFLESEVTFKKFSDTFRKYCKENSAGLANDFDPVLNIYNLNWFYKTLQINVKENYPDRHFDSEEVGAGMQNLLLISIFQTYAELMGGKVIFGIEEPEIYLYPQAQRALYKNLIRLSENTQIIYSTHNPNFVDAARPDDIISLRKNPDKGTYVLEKDQSLNTERVEENKHKIHTHFNPERNELFFARKALLVEGESDKIYFTTLCENIWNINLDENGISIIECGGKRSVAYFVGVCRLLGYVDYFAIWDKDKALEKAELLDEAKATGKGLELEPNLEDVLGLPAGRNVDKVKNAYEWAANESNKPPTDFEKVRQFLLEPEHDQSSVISPENGINADDIPF